MTDPAAPFVELMRDFDESSFRYHDGMLRERRSKPFPLKSEKAATNAFYDHGFDVTDMLSLGHEYYQYLEVPPEQWGPECKDGADYEDVIPAPPRGIVSSKWKWRRTHPNRSPSTGQWSWERIDDPAVVAQDYVDTAASTLAEHQRLHDQLSAHKRDAVASLKEMGGPFNEKVEEAMRTTVAVGVPLLPSDHTDRWNVLIHSVILMTENPEISSAYPAECEQIRLLTEQLKREQAAYERATLFMERARMYADPVLLGHIRESTPMWTGKDRISDEDVIHEFQWSTYAERYPVRFQGFYICPPSDRRIMQNTEVLRRLDAMLPDDKKLAWLNDDVRRTSAHMAEVQGVILDLLEDWRTNGPNGIETLFFSDFGVYVPSWMVLANRLTHMLRAIESDEGRVRRAVRRLLHDVYDPLLSPVYPLGYTMRNVGQEKEMTTTPFCISADGSCTPGDLAAWLFAPHAPSVGVCDEHTPPESFIFSISTGDAFYKAGPGGQTLIVRPLPDNCTWDPRNWCEERRQAFRKLLEAVETGGGKQWEDDLSLMKRLDGKDLVKAAFYDSLKLRGLGSSHDDAAPVEAGNTKDAVMARVWQFAKDCINRLEFWAFLATTFSWREMDEMLSRYWYMHRIRENDRVNRVDYWTHRWANLEDFAGGFAAIRLGTTNATNVSLRGVPPGEPHSLLQIFERDDPVGLMRYLAAPGIERRLDDGFRLHTDEQREFLCATGNVSLHQMAVALNSPKILSMLCFHKPLCIAVRPVMYKVANEIVGAHLRTCAGHRPPDADVFSPIFTRIISAEAVCRPRRAYVDIGDDMRILNSNAEHLKFLGKGLFLWRVFLIILRWTKTHTMDVPRLRASEGEVFKARYSLFVQTMLAYECPTKMPERATLEELQGLVWKHVSPSACLHIFMGTLAVDDQAIAFATAALYNKVVAIPSTFHPSGEPSLRTNLGVSFERCRRIARAVNQGINDLHQLLHAPSNSPAAPGGLCPALYVMRQPVLNYFWQAAGKDAEDPTIGPILWKHIGVLKEMIHSRYRFERLWRVFAMKDCNLSPVMYFKCFNEALTLNCANTPADDWTPSMVRLRFGVLVGDMYAEVYCSALDEKNHVDAEEAGTWLARQKAAEESKEQKKEGRKREGSEKMAKYMAAQSTEERKAQEREKQRVLEADRKATAERQAKDAAAETKRVKADKELDSLFGWVRLKRALESQPDEQDLRDELVAAMKERSDKWSKAGLLNDATSWKRNHLKTLKAWLSRGARRGEPPPPNAPTAPKAEVEARRYRLEAEAEAEPEAEAEAEAVEDTTEDTEDDGGGDDDDDDDDDNDTPVFEVESECDHVAARAAITRRVARNALEVCPAIASDIVTILTDGNFSEQERWSAISDRVDAEVAASEAGPSGVHPTPPLAAAPPRPRSGVEADVCMMCEDDYRTVVALPCKHYFACASCFATCRQQFGTCPLCRETIQGEMHGVRAS